MPLLESISTVFAALSFRALPALVYGLFANTSALARPRRVAVGGAVSIVSAVSLGALSPNAFLEMCEVWCLLVLASGAAYFVYAAVPFRVRGDRLFLGLLLVFMLVPSVLWRSNLLVTYLVVGFELLFSSYSFFAERRSNRASGRELAAYLFFLIVDPTLVYTERSRPLATLERAATGRAVVRIVVGALAFWASLLVTHVSQFWLGSRAAVDTWPGTPRYFAYVADVLPYLCSLYWAHAGLAGFQIGLMALLGYETPERYRYPFLARSPSDLWRRWNIYLGEWLRRYLFAPLALRLLRRLGAAGGAGQSGAAVVTLTFCGLVHDLSGYCATLSTDFKATKCFFLAGGMMAMWDVASRFSSTLMVVRAWRASALRAATSGVSLALWFHGLLLLGSVLQSGRGPTLSAAAEPHGRLDADKLPD